MFLILKYRYPLLRVTKTQTGSDNARGLWNNGRCQFPVLWEDLKGESRLLNQYVCLIHRSWFKLMSC